MSDRLALALEELAAAIRAEVRAELEAAAPAPDRLLDVDEAAAALNLGRTATYQEISRGQLRSVTVGRRRLIPAAALRDFIAARTAEA